MTAVPAEPVKPLIHRRDFQCSGTYSPECGSVLGVMNALMPSLLMRRRREDMLSVVMAVSVVVGIMLLLSAIAGGQY